jgi:hypothetical protein
MLELVSAYAAGGEEAVKATGGQAAILLLEHFNQQPMPILEEEREHIRGRPRSCTQQSAP